MRNERVVFIIILLLLVNCTTIVQGQNFTNKGKEFWVGYGHNQYFDPQVGSQYNIQEMVLYLSASEEAHVTVSIPGTSWSKNYTVTANTAIPTDLIPKTGAEDCRILNEGLFTKSVHVVSDVPIVVFEHTYGSTSSGATMLLPVDVYGYTYISMNTEQNSSYSYSWVYVIASEDSTTVQITPAYNTMGGRKRGEPFTVDLKKGEIYNVMGVPGTDMSGTKVQSIPGKDGNCHRIGAFSGTSRTMICATSLLGGADYIMVQGFPVSAWGMNYITALTSSTLAPSTLNNNKFRVYLKDLTSKVYRNGVRLTGLINNSYYEYLSATSDYISCDKPIMVAQIITSEDGCGGPGDMDPEMIFISPLEQAINKVIFYSTDKEKILNNYLTLIIPDNGISSLLIDGSNSFDYTYSHPNKPGYTVVVKALPVTPMQHTAQSDSTFTAITYGLGYYESYGYNAGTYINNLTALPEIKPENNVGSYDYVCSKTPFQLSIKTIYAATAITIHFSQVANITPATDVTINNPVASGTTIINGKTYYIYDIPNKYEFSVGGDYELPVSVTAPEIDNCSQSEIVTIPIPVHQGPSVDFSALYGCLNENASFTFISIDPDAQFKQWDFGDNTTNTTQLNPSKKYDTAGTYNVKLQVIRNYDGCYGDTVKQVIIKPLPTPGFTLPATICMPEGKAVFTNTTTVKGVVDASTTYQWAFGDGQTDNATHPEHIYTAANSYQVKLIAVANGCTDSIEQTLPLAKFVNSPTADFSLADTAYCINQSVSFTNSSTYDANLPVTWQWSLGNGVTSAKKDADNIYPAAGNYSVSLLVVNGGCSSSSVTKQVWVYAPPVVEAGADVVLDKGDAGVLLGAVSSDTRTFVWSPAIHLSDAHVLHPVVTPEADQLYYLTATGKAGCVAYDSVLVRVYNDIKVPNIFTPNGDGINDVWEIKGLQDYSRATLDIFNRYGQVVYRITGGYSKPWNGASANGTPLPAGIYYYILQPGANGYGKITGSVTIVR